MRSSGEGQRSGGDQPPRGGVSKGEETNKLWITQSRRKNTTIHSGGNDDSIHRLEFFRRQVAERRMPAFPVIENSNIIKQTGSGRCTGFVAYVVDQLRLQRVKKTFLNRIVIAIALSAHAANHSMLL